MWAKSGLLQREIKLYQKLIEKYGMDIQFITYGDEKDRKWQKHLGKIQLFPVYERIKPNSNNIIALTKTILIPWFFRKELSSSSLFKTNQLWGGWVAVLSKWFFKKPLLVRCGYEHYSNSLMINNGFIKNRIINSISDFVIDCFKTDKNKITINPNWIDTKKFQPIKAQKIDEKKILFVGRLSKEKNIELLISSLQNIDVTLDIIGSGTEKQRLEKMATKLNVNVNFLGRIENDKLPNYYNNHQIYVLCSKFEGSPKTLLEAMSCGKAIIGTNVRGINDTIQNGLTGILVDEKENDLRVSINKLLMNKELREKLGNNARNFIIKNHSLNNIFKIEHEVYLNLLKYD